MKIYLIIEKYEDAEYQEWNEPSDYAFYTEEKAKEYIRRQNSNKYSYVEIDLL